jgi:hypothetical protein
MRAAALAAAMCASVLLPGEPLGIGVVLVAALVAATAATAARPGFDALVFGTLALALASLPAVLDAGWVVALDLAAALTLAAAAVSGPTVAAVLAPLARLRDAPPLVPRLRAEHSPPLRGALLGGLLVVPFAALFWTADAAYAELAGRVPLPSAEALPGRVVVFAAVLLAALGLALAARRPVRPPALDVPWKLMPWGWAVPLALLCALFLSFVSVQLAVLFGGHDHVLHTAGLTYAEYARRGFWQLLAAAALTLAVIGGAVLLADAPRRGQQLLLRALLGVLSALTLVILLSALHRLRLYEDTFGLTRARLGAEAVALWLGGLFLLLIAAAAARRARRHLPRAALAGTAVALLAFSLARPDAVIAERNIERWRQTGKLDVAYLQTLSADAAPALAHLPPKLRHRALAALAARLADPEPWSSSNRSRARARRIVAEQAPRD